MNLIDNVDWLSLPVDVKGTIYEQLLQRSARKSSRGAGQYFTPRPVIQPLVEVMQPYPNDRICDPGSGHLRVSIQRLQLRARTLEKNFDRDEKRVLREERVEGIELSPKVARMCEMNLYLHGIGGDRVVVHAGQDSLAAPWSKEYTMVLANPPFGRSEACCS